MTLKKCPCCKAVQTTKNVIKIGQDEIALYFNCATCDSTFLVRRKNWKQILFPEDKGLS